MRALALALASAAALGVAADASALDWPGHATAVADAYERAGDPERRAAALRRAVELDADVAALLLAQALQDRSAEVRAAAATAAGDTRAFAVQAELVVALSDRSATVRAAAARAVGALRAGEASTHVARLVADPEVEVREAAVASLAQLGTEDAAIALSGALRDRSSDVVVAALGGLAALGQPGSVYAVLEKVGDPNEAVAIAAIDALVALRADAAVDALLAVLDGERTAVVLAAIAGLGELADPAAAPALVGEVLSPGGAGAREAAIEALVAIRTPEAVRALRGLAGTRPALVRPYYATIGAPAWPTLREVARTMGPEADRFVPFLELWLASGDPEALAAVDSVEDASEARRLLRQSPTPEAFCTATERWGAALDADVLFPWASWGAETGAAACLGRFLETRGAAIAPEDQIALVEALAPGAPQLAGQFGDTFVDVDTLDAGAAGRLIGALREAGPAGAGLLSRLVFSEDPRIRRDATFALADLGIAGLSTHVRQVALSGDGDATALLRLLAPAIAAGDAEARGALVSALEGAPESRIEALVALAGTCEAPTAEVARAARSDAFWLRRAAYAYARTCEVTLDGDALADASLDAEGRRLTLPDGLEALLRVASDTDEAPDVRVAALLAIDAPSDSAAHVLDRSATVAAAAWLMAGEFVPTESERAMRALGAPTPHERAALFATLPADSPALAHALRRETNAEVRRVIAREEAYAAPVVVLAVDETSGEPRRDEVVFAITVDGSPLVERTDVEGRVVFHRDDVRAVFVGDRPR